MASPVLHLDIDIRGKEKADQQKSFVDILDSLHAVAEKRRTPLVVALDEFQEIVRLGSDRAEWSLRSAMQGHGKVAYFLAGSEERIIDQMVGKEGAFYQLHEDMNLGPIPSEE